MPCTPTSPTGSHISMALSVSSSNTVPIARTDKHVVLAMSPARPKVSSMQTKLDHTKIDTSLYEQVSNIRDGDKTRRPLYFSLSLFNTFCSHLSPVNFIALTQQGEHYIQYNCIILPMGYGMSSPFHRSFRFYCIWALSLTNAKV